MNVATILIELYAIKLTNYVMIMDATVGAHAIDDMAQYQKVKLDTKDKDIVRNRLLAQHFISYPVLYKLNGTDCGHPAKQPQCFCQEKLLLLLQSAQNKGIIKNGEIKDRKKFKTDVLEKCVLPVYLSTDRKGHIDYGHLDTIDTTSNVELFHSLTGADMPHLIREQMEQVFNERFYHPTFMNGVIYDADILRNALVKLRYYRFTNFAECKNAVGTDGMQLARQIRDRMFERVKKS